NGFMDCQPGMQRCVSEMLTEQRSFEFDFGDQVKIKLNEFKMQMLEELILTLHPTAYTTKTSKFQMTHLKNGFVFAFGKQFGLCDIEEAKLDKDKYKFSNQNELDNVIKAYDNKIK